MSTYMVTGEGKDEFYNLLKELLGDKVNGINAVVLKIEDDNNLSMEEYKRVLNNVNKPFNLTKLNC